MHIFISYAKKDTRSLTEELATNLGNIPDLTVWWDKSLKPGNAWSRQIENEIKRCDLFVVLISPDVNRDEKSKDGLSFVIREIGYAQKLRKTILVVLAQKTTTPIQIEAEQYIDFTKSKENGIKDVLTYLKTEYGIFPELQSQIEKLENDLIQLTKSIEIEKLRLEHLEAQYQTYQDIQAQLQAIQEAQKKLDRLKELQPKKEKHVQADQARIKVEERMEVLREEIDQIDVNLEELKEDYTILIEQIEEKDNLEQLIAQADEVDNQLEILKDVDERHQTLVDELDDTDKKIDRLRRELNNLSVERDNISKQIESTLEEKKERDKWLSIQEDIQSANMILPQIQATIKELKEHKVDQKYEDLTKKRSKLEADHTENNDEKFRLISQKGGYARSATEYDNLLQEKEQLVQTISELDAFQEKEQELSSAYKQYIDTMNQIGLLDKRKQEIETQLQNEQIKLASKPIKSNTLSRIKTLVQENIYLLGALLLIVIVLFVLFSFIAK